MYLLLLISPLSLASLCKLAFVVSSTIEQKQFCKSDHGNSPSSLGSRPFQSMQPQTGMTYKFFFRLGTLVWKADFKTYLNDRFKKKCCDMV